ncbi:hypothetical protein [Vineibacter terrae]|uniref:hypothetical protein n=1 Tax=Vineibacter terrae TaxID=2586908 RepID=UPI002E348033|nr:hypothetical protein [Vineibacter terrae]HEX2889899.1 hypothetical protein [Vineibacter terrae]
MGRNRRSILTSAAMCAWLAAAGGGAPAVQAQNVPAALVGSWGYAVASGSYCNQLGQCAPGSGGSQSLSVAADGRAEHAMFESALIDGCGQLQTMTRKVGTVAVRGAILVFSPHSGLYTSRNGCRPDLTGTWRLEAKDLAPVSISWQLSGGTLRLVDPTGHMSGVYSRR